MEIESCIYHVPVFRSLPEEGVERLVQAMHHRHLQPGETLTHAGEPLTSLVVVAKGLLRLSRTNKAGREQVLRELGPGEFYGEMALFTEVTSEGDLIAALETHACILERSAVQEVLRTQPHLAVSLVEAIASRLSEAERTIGELALLDVGERLVMELVRLADEAEAAGSATFELPVPWAQMATKLGTTPESLSRRLRRLSSQGLVEVEGRRVHIPDVQALRETVE
ncbi:MAG: Crp/Fnr family transcriptional regulator [Firmicutes bacterium]|jgi:CRP/FNR family transcriptional regulator|nr:Crp/Fnr family transcriptional regulator [Bacillota bacterium]